MGNMPNTILMNASCLKKTKDLALKATHFFDRLQLHKYIHKNIHALVFLKFALYTYAIEVFLIKYRGVY